MQRLHFSIVIRAPKEKVWHTMLDDAPYRTWAEAFNSGSYYKGDWSRGSKMLFLGPNPDGSGEGGMVSRIAENKPFEFISIEHIGIIKDGVEDTTSAEAKKWAPAFENYTLREIDPPSHEASAKQVAATEVLVGMDIEDEHREEFKKMWTEGLQNLKKLAEA